MAYSTVPWEDFVTANTNITLVKARCMLFVEKDVASDDM
jgi:hypothetical protein